MTFLGRFFEQFSYAFPNFQHLLRYQEIPIFFLLFNRANIVPLKDMFIRGEGKGINASFKNILMISSYEVISFFCPIDFYNQHMGMSYYQKGRLILLKKN